MCGNGVVLYFDVRPVDRSLLKTMAVTMCDWGPDDSSEFAGLGIWLVHRCLSIIDLSTEGRARCRMDMKKMT